MGVSEITSIISLLATVGLTLVNLSVKSAVSAWKAEQADQRARDKDDIRAFMDSHFLPAREADQRLSRIETRQEDTEKRLRRVEQRSNRRKAGHAESAD